MQSHSHADSPAVAAASETDVFIAGAGPAGLACAIALARKGMSVRVADGMKPPIDKACGEGLMPDTLAALEALGIDVDAAGGNVTARIRGIRFFNCRPDTESGSVAEARFPVRDGRGMKRRALYLLLLDRAVELGVRFRWETVVHSFAGSHVETNRGAIRARFIVGADGHQSRIRTGAGLERSSVTSRRIGLRQHFAAAPWSEFVEVYWSSQGQAYVTPVSSREVCVAFVAQHKFAGGVAEALERFPALQARLAGAMPSDAARGAVTYSRRLHRVARGNVALIGDASGSVDAVTGEGLSLCFRQALALADAVAANDLAAYQRAHTAMLRMPHLVAATMLTLDRYAWVRTGAIGLLGRFPAVFEKLLEVHIGHQPQPRTERPALVPAESDLLAS